MWLNLLAYRYFCSCNGIVNLYLKCFQTFINRHQFNKD
ncbi:hypothetical protein PLEI_2978 [Photobacterium leiognathi lrivu.4.1]|uniref:Uncharacterized protein n=1 Tax=Photobacterium leiognathi lrivu.4.1 TaxID=1248232 RepID=V5F287_PHOLE|nr:hypothetical protein PLEI_2978 [Photobacterium leiognathi lrivu.4.1]